MRIILTLPKIASELINHLLTNCVLPVWAEVKDDKGIIIGYCLATNDVICALEIINPSQAKLLAIEWTANPLICMEQYLLK